MATAPASGFYYGWAIVGLTFSTQFLMTGCVFYGFSVVLTSLADEFAGGDRTPVIAVQAIGGVAGMVCAPVVGRLMGRGHERRLITAGALAAGLALLGASRATALWQIAALFGTLIGLASHTLSATGPSTLVVHWFERRRATALATSQLGSSLGGMVMAPVVASLIAWGGWRGAYQVLGTLLLCTAPLLWWLVVGRPEDRGLRVDGLPAQALDDVAPALEVVPPFRTADALHEPNLWLIALAMGIAFMATTAVISHVVAFGSDAGFEPARAAVLASLMAGGAALGKLVFGRLSDLIGPRPALMLALVGQACGIVALIHVTAFASSVAAVLVTGVSAGGYMPLTTALLARAFGRRAFGPMMGLLWPIAAPFQLSGPVLAAWVHDVTGDYAGAFWLFVVGLFAALLLVRAIRLPEVEPGLREGL
ncbi:MAG: MFS transporter [Deltaproteobacteria bacterium]|nr:MFS transporter [Deltaproteobacteria bacterium]MBW2360631.1 MFS transporter [Deltaproteobacteria bacterium]